MRLAWLAPGDPPDSFPDPELALPEPNGLLAAGGDLSPERLLAAYRRGIFPWFSEGQPILWWSPDPRAILIPEEFHVSRSLHRTLQSDRFRVSVDQGFDMVIRLCASTRKHSGTWLTPEMIRAYAELHELGFAHSIEAWQDGQLAGGIYGINLGGIFFGESMVSVRRDGSKVAMAKLVSIARQENVEVIDCQLPNDHLTRLGSRSVPRREFLDLLARLARQPPAQRFKRQGLEPTSGLAGA